MFFWILPTMEGKQGLGPPALQADEEVGNEALDSSLYFTLIPDNWSPFSRAGGS